MGFRAQRSTHPTKLLLPSQLPIPDQGDGGAPGGGILSPSRPVTARHHVCEAWAIPRNRDGASRRSTVTVFGPAPRSAPELPPARLRGRPLLPASLPVGQGSRTSRQRFYEPPRDATSRSAFRKRF